MDYLFKTGNEWTWSKIYYDSEKDCFIEEKYHEEYVDTGTICDGTFLISDNELWDILVKEANEQGMATYIKIRGSAPSERS